MPEISSQQCRFGTEELLESCVNGYFMTLQNSWLCHLTKGTIFNFGKLADGQKQCYQNRNGIGKTGRSNRVTGKTGSNK
jgi:hypothetical protein